jgi:hypothetical protein
VSGSTLSGTLSGSQAGLTATEAYSCSKS